MYICSCHSSESAANKPTSFEASTRRQQTFLLFLFVLLLLLLLLTTCNKRQHSSAITYATCHITYVCAQHTAHTLSLPTPPTRVAFCFCLRICDTFHARLLKIITLATPYLSGNDNAPNRLTHKYKHAHVARRLKVATCFL